MDTTRRTIRLVVCVLATAVLAAGCGDDDSGASSGGEQTPAPKVVGTDPAAAPEIGEARTIELPGEEVFPEGIAIDEAGERIFVSSTADGTIYTGAPDDDALEPLEVGANGPSTAIGLATGPDDVLWVAGGDTGMAWRIDRATGRVLGSHRAPGSGPTFVNDVVVARDGTAYLTDSMRPTIYTLAPDAAANATLEVFLDLDGSAIQYEEGFNLNGIELTDDEQHLLVVQANTGELFRVPVAGGEAEAVDLAGETLVGGDGLELDEQRLYVVLGDAGEVAVVDLDAEEPSGEVVARLAHESFARPTTLVTDGDTMLVVNSQFDARESPMLPFTVSALELD